MSTFGASSEVPTAAGYFRTKFPSTNKGHGFTTEERDKFGMRGLFPGGTPFTLEQKVAVRILSFLSIDLTCKLLLFLHYLSPHYNIVMQRFDWIRQVGSVAHLGFHVQHLNHCPSKITLLLLYFILYFNSSSTHH